MQGMPRSCGKFAVYCGSLAGREQQNQMQVGKDVTLEDGRHAAQLCIINCLAAARGVIGHLERIERVVKVPVTSIVCLISRSSRM